jgi:hypothetical protein
VGDFFSLDSIKSPYFFKKGDVFVALSVLGSPYFLLFVPKVKSNKLTISV